MVGTDWMAEHLRMVDSVMEGKDLVLAISI
jgi:hypothetical protein